MAKGDPSAERLPRARDHAPGAPRLRGFHTITLGCKLNQFDTAAIEAELARRGFPPQPDVARAEVVVVNTCTVTGKADAEARKLIRGVRRRNSGCRLFVTGCYAEREAATLRALPGVDRVFGNRDKPRLPALLDEEGVGGWSATTPAVVPLRSGGDRGCDAAADLPRALHFGDRSRAFLRIQEGCDLRCSYCIIPSVRGPSRSVPPERVEQSLGSLLQAGYREVVLTGVNTGDYGKDLAPRTSLAALLERLLATLGPNRLRLNSLEPRTVTDEIIDRMARDPRLVPHLQVPLQSGSDAVLRGMRRNYRVRHYLERLAAVRAAVPDAALGADVIVGFPGESDARFEETYRAIGGSPLNYLHVFAWSPRPGTPAAELGDRVHGTAIRERSARLRRLGERLGERFRRSQVGRTLDAIVLDGAKRDTGGRALTGNFIEVGLEPHPRTRRGELLDVLVVDADATGARAVVRGTPAWC